MIARIYPMLQRHAVLLAVRLCSVALCSLAALASTAVNASTDPPTPGAPAAAAPRGSAPTASPGSPPRVIAVASAVGNEFNWSMAGRSTGTNLDPDLRGRIRVPDKSVDVAAIRGVLTVLDRAFAGAEFVFLRLERDHLSEVLRQHREEETFQALLAQVAAMPERTQWDRIVLLTPAYRGFASEGLGAKLFGIGVYVRDYSPDPLDDDKLFVGGSRGFAVVEPDGTPGLQPQRRYVALYGFMNVVIVDAASLVVLERRRWSFEEKIHDSRGGWLRVLNSLPVDVLAERFERFVERTSRVAVAATLGGSVEFGELQEIKATDLPPVPHEQR